VSFAIATGTVVFLIDIALEQRLDEQLERFGHALAETTAELATEPMRHQDRIGLSNLASRTAALDEVLGVSLYTIDNKLLALSGREPGGVRTPNFTHAVTAEDTITGYARIVLDRDRFSVSAVAALAVSWPAWLAVFITTTGLAYALRQFSQPTQSRGDKGSRGERNSPEIERPRSVFMLAINLFNQISVRSDEKIKALELALNRAGWVANVYVGRAEVISDTGILLTFDDNHADRCFEVLCASLLVARVLEELSLEQSAIEKTPLTFRYGLHLCANWETVSDSKNSDHVSDAVLLSSLAPNGKVAISEDVSAMIDRPERLECGVMLQSAAGALATTTAGKYRLVNSLTGTYEALLQRQAELLSTQASSISNASTL
jgi:hypothetical protein